ncbi:MAG: hypothetical protein QNJ20_10520 [Paracoccaceae bacterium]|nr:hypothetical protein [Paracoccaceae bacterium]
MATADRYSRLILWLKVSLPLAALAILSTLFFVAETLDPESAIPYAEVDVARILRDQGVTGPTFGGITADGVAVALSATSIRPDAARANNWFGQTLTAKLELPSGAEITIDSPEGLVDAGNRQATLQGGARLESSTGYTVNTPSIVASFEDATVVAGEGVEAVGPPGTITAREVMLKRLDTEPPSHHLVFQGDVRLVVRPAN